MEKEAFDDEFYEGLEDIDWNDGWSEVSEPRCSGEDGFVKGLEDIDWDENLSEVSELCGSDSLCCIDVEAKKKVCTPSIEPYSRPSRRFQKIVNEEDIEKAIVLRNTARSTNWGVSIFEAWCDERGIEASVTDMTDVELNNYVARFVHEAVKKDGVTPYPPNSLYQIVVLIQRYLRESGRPDVSFFDSHSSAYDTLRKSLDARMKALTAEGFGTERKSAQPITRDMESLLWDKGIFFRGTAIGLLNIVYFYNCKLFGLRAGDEHRTLSVEQFHFSSTSDGCNYMQFIGRNCKTYQGGIKHRQLMPKDLKIYAIPELGERDIVSCFQYYLSLIPSEGPFYRRPGVVTKSTVQPYFTKQVVGKNTLNGLVQRFCTEAGLDGYFTGHSGKVTCATELFRNMIDEQLIQAHTGHRSRAGVQCYKRPGEQHFKHVSKILQPPPSKKPSTENDDPCSEKTSPPEKKRELSTSQKRTPLAPLSPAELFQNNVGSMPGTFQATNGGNITFNFNK